MFYSTIHEYQLGLLWKQGKIVRALKPGRYFASPFTSRIQKFDARTKLLKPATQEVITSDRAEVKINLLVEYRIDNPAILIRSVENYSDALYARTQLALRELVGAKTLDELLADREPCNQVLQVQLERELQAIGIALVKASIKDIVLPRKLKDAYGALLAAKADGIAQLEAARAQTATLRHLANGADLIQMKPEILDLLALQGVSQNVGHSINLKLGKERTQAA